MKKRSPINWVWAPAAVVWVVLNWERLGPLVAITSGAAGVGLGLWGNYRWNRMPPERRQAYEERRRRGFGRK